jgi:hypothetical protein
MRARPEWVPSLAVVLLGCRLAAGAEPPALPPDVAFAVKKPGDPKALDLQGEKVQLTFQKVTFKEGDSLDKLLRAGGVTPDIEALALVYARNPTADAKSFRPGAELLLPTVQGGERLKKALTEGYLAEPTLEPKLKAEFMADAEAVQGLAKQFAALQPERFAGADSQRELVASVQAGAELLGSFREVVRDRTWPLGPDMIRDLHGEARQLRALLEGVVKANVKPAEVGERVVLVEDDLKVRAEIFKEKKGPGQPPPRSRDTAVKVETFGAADGKPLHKLIVYYVPLALKDRPEYVREFGKVTSPADEVLAEANYYIWAGKPGSRQPSPFGKAVPVRKLAGVKEQVAQLVVP